MFQLFLTVPLGYLVPDFQSTEKPKEVDTLENRKFFFVEGDLQNRFGGGRELITYNHQPSVFYNQKITFENLGRDNQEVLF